MHLLGLHDIDADPVVCAADGHDGDRGVGQERDGN